MKSSFFKQEKNGRAIHRLRGRLVNFGCLLERKRKKVGITEKPFPSAFWSALKVQLSVPTVLKSFARVKRKIQRLFERGKGVHEKV